MRKNNRLSGLTGGLGRTAICLAAVACPTAVMAADWPGFRGSQVDGISSEKSDFDRPGGISLNAAWKIPIGSGYAGVAVSGQTVVTMFADGESDVIAAYDTESGKERWRATLGKTYTGHDGSHTGPISTPLIAQGNVYALDAWGRLLALALDTGKEVWSFDLAQKHGAKKPHYGFTTSPIMMDGVLIVQGAVDGKAVVALNPSSGEVLWSLGDDTVTYQTPIPYEMNGKRQLLAAGQKKLFGVDVSTGSLLWDYDHGGTGARGVSSLTPVPSGDGKLFLALHDESSAMVQLNPSDDGVEVSPVWDGRTIRNSYNVPVYHNGHVYAYSSRFLTCVNAKDGKPAWRSRQPGDGFLIMVDGHLVIATKAGGVHVAKVSGEGYEEKAGIPIFDELAWSAPAYANGSIYARSLSELARIDIVGADGGLVAADANNVPTPEGGRFASFLAQVANASDKKTVVDAFMKSNKQFPVTESDRVHFIYRGDAQDLAVQADIFGARQERAMKRVDGTDLFYFTAELESDARSNYKFVKDYEEILDPRNDRKTSTTIYSSDMEMSFGTDAMEISWFSMPEWRVPKHLAEAPASRRGTVEAAKLESTVVSQVVEFDVYLPAGYDKNGSIRYPVIYVHGGKDAMERGELVKALDNLAGTEIAPSIAVFIAPPARGPAVVRLMADELIPFMDKNYLTIPAADARANYGTGFASISALAVTFGKRDMFGAVACQSPFVFDSMMPMVTGAVDGHTDNPPRMYMDWGKYDLRNPHEAWDLTKTARKLADYFHGAGVRFKGGEVHDGTGWSSWKTRVDLAFNTLFPKDWKHAE
ncbi:MAG: outer membrane protein assembly factor BamB family protein [Planctomycetota bacterium]|jgi:outer membrane protein assembly factor BamB/enterochelin esterase-like enzyme